MIFKSLKKNLMPNFVFKSFKGIILSSKWKTFSTVYTPMDNLVFLLQLIMYRNPIFYKCFTVKQLQLI